VIASDEIRLGNPDPIPLARSASSTAAGLFPSWGSPAPHLTSPTVAAARRIRSAGRLRWVEAFQENSAVAFFVYLVGRSHGHPDLHHTTGRNCAWISTGEGRDRTVVHHGVQLSHQRQPP
jgi:hypothetical protein